MSEASNNNPWGQAETQFFFELSPEKILSSVEQLGFRTTGRILQLNSMENRVYQVEIEIADNVKIKSPSERFKIVKFYRPGRWSNEQIIEEHQFIKDLSEHEIPVVTPICNQAGESLLKVADLDIWFVVWPMLGGRSPDELSNEQAERVGRLLGRIHRVGKIREANNRIKLIPHTYAFLNLEFLLQKNIIPFEYLQRYKQIVTELINIAEPWWQKLSLHRIHGDSHFGNLLWNDQGPFWVDFDDMLIGPAVQDIWLMLPGRGNETKELLESLLKGYETMNDFDRNSLRLIEMLRAFRFIHFSTWIAKRWHDPAFPRNFPHYGTTKYWGEQIHDLEEQLRLVKSPQIYV